jgi:hypothetical protein
MIRLRRFVLGYSPVAWSEDCEHKNISTLAQRLLGIQVSRAVYIILCKYNMLMIHTQIVVDYQYPRLAAQPRT